MSQITNEEIHSVNDINSEKAIEYFENKTNLGKINNASIKFSYTGPCKETMKFYILINNRTIKNMKFQYKGCSVLASCGSAICELARGKTLSKAKAITPTELKKHLKISRYSKIDCPLLTIRTLRKAIDKYETKNSLSIPKKI